MTTGGNNVAFLDIQQLKINENPTNSDSKEFLEILSHGALYDFAATLTLNTQYAFETCMPIWHAHQ